jgi:hypothetical protein
MPAQRPPFTVINWLLTVLAAASLIVPAKADAKNGEPSSARQTPGPHMIGEWRLVRTPDPNGGPEAVSIMHTADASRSDFDLAGLMIRCGKEAPEALIVLLRAFPLGERLSVTLGRAGNDNRYEATVAPPGTALLLPPDATRLVSTSWSALKELSIQIENGETKIHGVVALAGLQPGLKLLTTSCPAR